MQNHIPVEQRLFSLNHLLVGLIFRDVESFGVVRSPDFQVAIDGQAGLRLPCLHNRQQHNALFCQCQPVTGFDQPFRLDHQLVLAVHQHLPKMAVYHINP